MVGAASARARRIDADLDGQRDRPRPAANCPQPRNVHESRKGAAGGAGEDADFGCEGHAGRQRPSGAGEGNTCTAERRPWQAGVSRNGRSPMRNGGMVGAASARAAALTRTSTAPRDRPGRAASCPQPRTCTNRGRARPGCRQTHAFRMRSPCRPAAPLRRRRANTCTLNAARGRRERHGTVGADAERRNGRGGHLKDRRIDEDLDGQRDRPGRLRAVRNRVGARIAEGRVRGAGKHAGFRTRSPCRPAAPLRRRRANTCTAGRRLWPWECHGTVGADAEPRNGGGSQLEGRQRSNNQTESE